MSKSETPKKHKHVTVRTLDGLYCLICKKYVAEEDLGTDTDEDNKTPTGTDPDA